MYIYCAVLHGMMSVNSTNHVSCPPHTGYWINKFAADLQVTNPSDQRVAVTDILGFYMDKGQPFICLQLSYMYTVL